MDSKQQGHAVSNLALETSMHYGPVWSKPRRSGDSFAACNVPGGATLTTHSPWVTCPDCLAYLAASSTDSGATK